MEILNIYPNPERSEWAALTERCTRQEEEITRQVASILDEVRTGGDRALREITRRIEGRDCETFEVPADIRRAAAELVPAALKEALATAKANIEAFHRAQLPPRSALNRCRACGASSARCPSAAWGSTSPAARPRCSPRC